MTDDKHNYLKGLTEEERQLYFKNQLLERMKTIGDKAIAGEPRDGIYGVQAMACFHATLPPPGSKADMLNQLDALKLLDILAMDEIVGGFNNSSVGIGALLYYAVKYHLDGYTGAANMKVATVERYHLPFTEYL